MFIPIPLIALSTLAKYRVTFENVIMELDWNYLYSPMGITMLSWLTSDLHAIYSIDIIIMTHYCIYYTTHSRAFVSYWYLST